MTPQFKHAVLTYGPRFQADLGLTTAQVAGMFGNFAVESDQFRALQEYKPTVKGSKGGWGWPQWTGYGPGGRRGMFERWADGAGIKRDDPEGFYQFILIELGGSEKRALAALRRTTTAASAAVSFMKMYERPGVPHLARRKAFAEEAMALLLSHAGAPVDPAKRPGDRMNVGAGKPAKVATPPVATVPVPPTPVTRPWWHRLFGLKREPVVTRPGLAPGGDPALYDIQATLKRLKYPVGLLDGLMGKNTKTAIWDARRRNGLPDGNHIDDAFKAALPGMLPAEVSKERAEASHERLRQEAPEATRQLDGLGFVGKLILGASGIGAVDASGALEQVKVLTAQGTETLATVQTAVSFVVTAVQWAVDHWWLLGLLAGAVVLWKVGMAALRLLVLLRQGRLV